MEEGNFAVLVDAKTEYTKQLVNIFAPNIYLNIKELFLEVKEKCQNNNNKDETLYNFQISLSEIPKWNQEVIIDKYNNIINTSGCDWLDELLTAVFVSHTRILTSINSNKNKNKINLKIPKVDHFMHLCYIEVARNVWKNPYLFDDNVTNFEYQRNRREAECLIDATINETIRKHLPVKHILKEYLGSEFQDNDISDEKLNEDMSSSEKDNLRKMVQAEIENCSKEKLSKLNIETSLETTESPTVDTSKKSTLLPSTISDTYDTETTPFSISPPPEFSTTTSITPNALEPISKLDLNVLETSREVLVAPSIEVQSPSSSESIVKSSRDSLENIPLEESKKVLSVENNTSISNINNSNDLNIESLNLDDDINNLINNEVSNLEINVSNLDTNPEELKIDNLNLDFDLNDLSNDVSNSLPNDLSNSLPNDVSNSLPNDLSNSLPNDVSTSLPNDVSTSLPNDVSTILPNDVSTILPNEFNLNNTQNNDSIKTIIIDTKNESLKSDKINSESLNNDNLNDSDSENEGDSKYLEKRRKRKNYSFFN